MSLANFNLHYAYKVQSSRMIGAPKFLNNISKVSENNTYFPPYNVTQLSKDDYVLDIAVAGYDPNNITVVYEEDILTVQTKDFGVKNTDYTNSGADCEYPRVIHKAISNRRFRICWALMEYLQIDKVEYKNGIISIHIKYVLPESKKAKEFPLTTV